MNTRRKVISSRQLIKWSSPCAQAMATNLALDDQLIEQARIVGRHRTKKAAVTEALEEYVERRRQIEVLGLFDSIEYDPEYDYKDQRRRP